MARTRETARRTTGSKYCQPGYRGPPRQEVLQRRAAMEEERQRTASAKVFPLESLPAEIINVVTDWIRTSECSEYPRDDFCTCSRDAGHGDDIRKASPTRLELPQQSGVYSLASATRHLRAVVFGEGPETVSMDGHRDTLKKHERIERDLRERVRTLRIDVSRTAQDHVWDGTAPRAEDYRALYPNIRHLAVSWNNLPSDYIPWTDDIRYDQEQSTSTRAAGVSELKSLEIKIRQPLNPIMNDMALADTVLIYQKFLRGLSTANLKELHVVCQWQRTYMFEELMSEWWDGIGRACTERSTRLDSLVICMDFPYVGCFESVHLRSYMVEGILDAFGPYLAPAGQLVVNLTFRTAPVRHDPTRRYFLRRDETLSDLSHWVSKDFPSISDIQQVVDESQAKKQFKINPTINFFARRRPFATERLLLRSFNCTSETEASEDACLYTMVENREHILKSIYDSVPSGTSESGASELCVEETPSNYESEAAE